MKLIILFCNLIIILIFFIVLNYLIDNQENFENTIDDDVKNSWLDFCKAKPKSYLYNPNFKSYNNIEEENIITTCAKENEKCMLDSKGQNTCCGNLKCIRKTDNFQYKVCSNLNDACRYFKNDYLKYIFDEEYWNKYFNDIKKYFERNYGSNSNTSKLLNEKRKEIVDYINANDPCKTIKTSEDIKKKLDEFFTKDQIFSGLIYGAKKVSDNEENNNDDTRNCRDKSSTLALI